VGPDELGISVVGALAVDVEPVVFWDGEDPPAEELLDGWLSKDSVGFVIGDSRDAHGRVTPAGNGSSGRQVVQDILAPMGLEPHGIWFTDVVTWFFVKDDGTSKRRSQRDVLNDVYEPFASRAGLSSADLPDRPTPARLVTEATESQRDRLRTEFRDASAPLVITLGEEARAVLATIADESSGAPTAPLTRDRYGEQGSVSVGGHEATWYALTHPGNRHPTWQEANARWVDEVAT
jgi:hypothetical protein